MSLSRRGALVIATLLFSPTPLVAQPLVRVGIEFRVNAYTQSGQLNPAITSDGAGGFLVVWESSGQDGFDGHGIFGRRFDSAGTPKGVEFQVNAYTSGQQRYPGVASDGDGDFVVVWQSNGQDGSDYGVFGRRFGSNGVPLTGELQINSYTPDYQGVARVAADADGDFVVIWMSYNHDGDEEGAFARRFDSSGAPQANEFQLASSTVSYQYPGAVAYLTNGDFVISWDGYEPGTSSSEVLARRYDSVGSPSGAEFQVNTTLTFSQYDSNIAVAADGDFVIAWISNSQDGQFGGVFGRRFDSAANAQGIEFQINTITAGSQESTAIAGEGDGDFVVAWRSNLPVGTDIDVFSRSFSSSGSPRENAFRVNSYTPGNQLQPDIAGNGDGGFMAVWVSEGQDGSFQGVFAQRLAVSLATLDVDGNGLLAALTDGLLILRFRFGFTGATLTASAIGGGCTRCSSAAIESYLTGLGLTLDIDGNGVLEPLTDGLLVLRYVFGFSGTTLTNNAVGDNCTRCDASTIVPYLQTID